MVELGPANKVEKLFEIFLGLAGVSHDKRGSDHDVGDLSSEAIDNVSESLPTMASAHAAKHCVARVL